MTEDMGRFTTDKEGFCIIDFIGNEVWEGKYFDETKSLCNQLNNLCNENRELKTENEQLKSEKKDMQILINTISDQRNEFHRGVRENANRVGKLEKENEQLKKENEHLKKELGNVAEFKPKLAGWDFL